MRINPSRLLSIDLVRGLAIIGVIFIHSKGLDGSRFMIFGFGHAVPIFVILFGLNSELWWRKHDASLAGWYRTRARDASSYRCTQRF